MAEILIGFTDYTKTVFIPDPASTDGSGKTGLVAANLTVSYTRVETDNDVVVTDVTSSLNDLAALTTAHTDWGLKEVSSTLAPGLYRLDFADAVFASGAWTAVVYVMITTSAAAASPIEFELVAFNRLDGVRMGLTALPNAAADAAGGLPISDAGGLDLDTKLANTNEITVARMGALTDWINGGRLDLILDIIAADTTTDIPALIATLQAFVDTEVAAILAAVDTEVAAILADTNELQTDWTNGGRLDLILDIIAADTTTDIPALIATLQGFVDTEVAAIKAVTDQLAQSVKTIVEGTCAALGTTTIIIASALSPDSAVNDQFNGRIIIFTEDTTTTALRGQATDITDYVHATKTFTVTALTTSPASGDTFVIL